MKTYSVFLHLTNFTKHNTLQVHPCCCKWQNFIFFYDTDRSEEDGWSGQAENKPIHHWERRTASRGLDEEQKDKVKTVNREEVEP